MERHLLSDFASIRNHLPGKSLSFNCWLIGVPHFSLRFCFCNCPPLVSFSLAFITPMALTFAFAPGEAITFKKIALTGDSVPNTDNGTTFRVLGLPVLNNSGTIAFRAGLTRSDGNSDNEFGIYSSDGELISEVVTTGDIVPSSAGSVRIHEITLPVLNDSGQIAFVGDFSYLPRETTTARGIFMKDNDAVEFLARPNFQILSYVSDIPPAFNDSGQVLFRARYRQPPILEIFASPVGEEFRIVLPAGADAPDTQPGTVFRSPSVFADPVLNNSGQTVFSVGLAGKGVDDTNDEGIFFESNDILRLVARTGDAAPDTEPGVLYSDSFSNPVLNNLGQIAFTATLSGVGTHLPFDMAIFSGMSDNLNLVARTGDTLADFGPNIQLHAIDSLAINHVGQIAFSASLKRTNNSVGIFIEVDGSLQTVARIGAIAPGTESQMRFQNLTTPILNDAGQVAFRAFIQDLNGGGIMNGVFATDTAGELKLIARQGDLLDVDPDPLIVDHRRIEDVSILPSSSSGDGRPRSFNNAGQLALLLNFSDGSQGIFVATIRIPEPVSLLLLGVGIMLRLCRRQ